jgi:hypothetical protein
MNCSPEKNELRTKGTTRSTRGLSVGFLTLAGSMRKPRSWAYSTKAWLKLGSRLSALTTMLDMLSGMTTLKTPPKKPQAASKPEMTTSVVWRKPSCT